MFRCRTLVRTKLDVPFAIGHVAAVADEKKSRREALTRIGLTGGVLGASALTARLLYDHGGYGLSLPPRERQMRDLPVQGDAQPPLAIAKSSHGTGKLVQRAV